MKKLKKYVIGVDPGKNGAVTIFRLKKGNIKPIIVFNVPLREKLTGKGYHIDFKKLKERLDGYNIVEAYLENVSAMHQQGATGAFYFGGCFFGLLGLIIGKGIPVYLISPKKWRYNVQIKNLEKNQLVEYVLRRFPHITSHIQPILKDQDKAESLLIGVIGYSVKKELEFI